jgi:hypothetical protein
MENGKWSTTGADENYWTPREELDSTVTRVDVNTS